MHLQPDELIDLAEGARAESSAPHLTGCAVCRGQGSPLPFWWSRLGRRHMVAQAIVVGAMAMVIAIVVNVRKPQDVAPTVAEVDQAMPEPQSGDDPSLVLVAELTSELDLDGAAEAGFAPRGSAEHAVTHMDRGELRELQRLLQQEMGNSGA